MRLIDADALLDDLKSSAKDAREWEEETQDEEIKIRDEQTFGTFVECALRVKNAPTIEAEPVRHGRWECGGFCSECGIDNEERKTDFCPNCGARMDGG